MATFRDDSLVVFLPTEQAEGIHRFVPRYSYNYVRRTPKRLRPVISTTVNFCFPGFALVRASFLDENSTPLRINGRVATITGDEANTIPLFHEMRGKPRSPKPGSYVTVWGLFDHLRFLVIKTDGDHCYLDQPALGRKTWKVAPHLLLKPVVGKIDKPKPNSAPEPEPFSPVPGPAAPFKGVEAPERPRACAPRGSTPRRVQP